MKRVNLIVWLLVSFVLFVFIFDFVIYNFSLTYDCKTWDCVETYYYNDGIVVVDYKNLWNMNIGKIEHPNFITNPEWYIKNAENRNNEYYIIPYNYPWSLEFTNGTYMFVKDPPFYSCEGQGNALSVLMDEYLKTNNTKYRDAAYMYFNGFEKSELNDNYWFHGFYYKTIGGTYILNSQIYCLNYLKTFYDVSGDKRALELYNKGVERLEKDIDWYTVENGTRYSKIDNVIKSHITHRSYTDILGILVNNTGSEKLERVYKKWDNDYQKMIGK